MRNETTRLLSYSLLVAFSACEMRAQQSTVPTDVVPSEGDASSVTPPKGSAERTPNPPRVSCQAGQLTIAADNSTLSSVLAGVRACLGVAIDMPNGSADERTYLQLGPGPTREVLDALLNSTDFNYVIQSSNSSQEKILTILLTARTKDINDGRDNRDSSLAANLTMTPARRAWLASRSAAAPAATRTDDEEHHLGEGEAVAPTALEQDAPPQVDSKTAVVGADASNPGDLSKENESPSKAPAPTAPETPAPPDAVPAAISSDPPKETPAANELQNKINQMQQLFEERKNMISNPSASPK